MIPLLVYAYIDGVRSSRKIEKLCERDIVLTICTEAGSGEIGTVSLDGVKVKADAGLQANRTYQNLKEEAEQLDQKEDEEYGKEVRGDELPDDLTDPDDRLERIKECKERIKDEAKQKEKSAGEAEGASSSIFAAADASNAPHSYERVCEYHRLKVGF